MKNTPKNKIIIVGAGIAGLAAYTRLIEYGFDVKILEARDCSGGRIWTDHTLGLPLGRGASWIHGTKDNPIAQLAKNSNANMVIVDPNKFVTFNRNGNPIHHNDIQSFNEKFHTLLKQAKELALSSKNDISLSSALSCFVNYKDFSNIEKDLFETELISMESYIGASYEFLSARHWDYGDAWPGENYFLTSSYQPILEYLINNCPVQFNSIVKKINTRANDIEVVTEKSSYYADAVIITVPLGVLKKNGIIFNPPLPSDKQNAIKNLDMALLNITAIKFPTSFWPKDNHAIFFPQFDNSSIPLFFNLHHFTQHPILIGLSGGERARQLENLTDGELIDKIMHNFKSIFGSQLPEPESFFNTRWSQDSLSYGSYSYTPIGATGNDYETLANPISDKLFFAGEATSIKYPATTHGAYLSGIREAERIKNLYV